MSNLSAWCVSQQALLERTRPGMVASVRRIARRSVPFVAALGLLLELAVLARGHGGDFDALTGVGSRLLRGDADVFADSYVQVGPLYLALLGLGHTIGGWVGLRGWFGAMLPPALASVGLLLVAARGIARQLQRPEREAFVAAAVFFGGTLVISASYGHPEEGLVGLLVVVATAAAWNGRRVWAPGLLLAAAVTIKLWALVAVGLLLVRATRRVQLLRVALFAGATTAAYLPFFLVGDVGTFDMAWRVQSPAPLSLVFADGSAFGYRQRALQVLLAAAVGAFVALRARSADVVWVLPVTVIASRLVLDPLPSPYYWSVLVLALLLRVMALERSLLECLLLAFAVDVAGLLVITLAQGRWGAIALTVLAATSVTATLRSQIR